MMSFIWKKAWFTNGGGQEGTCPSPALARDLDDELHFVLARIGSAAHGQRHAQQAAAGLDPAAAVASGGRLDVGEARVRAALRRRAVRVLRVPDLSHVRLLLRAALGSQPAAPAPA